jgi:hypothetical protein
MASERSAKLRRIDDMRRRLPQISAYALQELLRDVGDQGMPEFISRASMRRARSLICDAVTPHGPLMQTIDVDGVDGGKVPLYMAHPLAFLCVLYDQCESWRTLLRKSHAARPSSFENPWSLVLYTDEVDPGDPLVPDHGRKVQAFYMSFFELGHEQLCRENAWLCVCANRSVMVKEMMGGLSQMVGCILKQIFPKDGCNLNETGIHLSFQDEEPIRLFAKFTTMVQDGGAHKEVWNCKGDAGLRMCIGCNVVNSNTDLMEFCTSDKLVQNCTKASELTFAEDADIRDATKRLKRFHDAKHPDFENVEKAIGFTYCRYMLCNDPALDDVIKPASQFMHDWMHGLFANGVFNLVMHYVIQSLEDDGVEVYDIMFAYIKEWHFPRRVGNQNLHETFNKKRRQGNRKSCKFRASASEGLSLFQILAFWATSMLIPLGKAAPACHALVAFCFMAECFTSVARGSTTPALLLLAIERFLELFTNVWGTDPFIPKMHWLLHYPRELHQHGTLLACFVHERKHKHIRRYAVPTQNTRCYEQTVMQELTCQQLHDLQQPECFNTEVGLIQPKACALKAKKAVCRVLETTPGDHIIRSSLMSRINAFESCGRQDVVLVKTSAGKLIAGEVKLHTDVDGVPVSLVTPWALKSFSSVTASADWLVSDVADALDTALIVTSVVWCKVSAHCVRTLIPSDLHKYF